MRIRSPKDFWAGLIFIAIGGGFVVLAQQYRLGDMHRMGPAMLPTLVGGLLAAVGVIIAVRAFPFPGEPVARFYFRPIGRAVLGGTSCWCVPWRGWGGGRGGEWGARARRRVCRARRASTGESRARGGHDRLLGRGLRLAAGSAAAALANFLSGACSCRRTSAHFAGTCASETGNGNAV